MKEVSKVKFAPTVTAAAVFLSNFWSFFYHIFEKFSRFSTFFRDLLFDDFQRFFYIFWKFLRFSTFFTILIDFLHFLHIFPIPNVFYILLINFHVFDHFFSWFLINLLHYYPIFDNSNVFYHIYREFWRFLTFFRDFWSIHCIFIRLSW